MSTRLAGTVLVRVAVPEQEIAEAVANGPYSLNVTSPGAIPPDGKYPLEIVAVSLNEAPLPMVSDVGFGVALMLGCTGLMTSGSLVQTLSAAALRPPPE